VWALGSQILSTVTTYPAIGGRQPAQVLGRWRREIDWHPPRAAPGPEKSGLPFLRRTHFHRCLAEFDSRYHSRVKLGVDDTTQNASRRPHRSPTRYRINPMASRASFRDDFASLVNRPRRYRPFAGPIGPPGDFPPCIRHRPFGTAGAMQGGCPPTGLGAAASCRVDAMPRLLPIPGYALA
jgi:hypothetical protein